MPEKDAAYDDRLLAKVLIKRFAPGGKTPSHEKIASELGITRLTVTRLLDRAEAEGYIRTWYYLDRTRQKELAMCDKFNLYSAYIVKMPGTDLSPESYHAILGQAGAVCFHQQLNYCIELAKKRANYDASSTAMKIGMAGGQTVAAVAQNVLQGEEEVEVFPIAGTTTDDSGSFSPETNASFFVSRYGIHARMRPGFCLKAEVDEKQERIERFEMVPNVLSSGEIFDLALIGIGAPAKGSTYNNAINLIPEPIRSKILNKIKGKQIVGDVCSCLIEEDGQLADDFGYSDQIICVKPGRFREMYQQPGRVSRIIAVAGGAAKVTAIRAALYGGNLEKPDPYFNILVTDEDTADNLLK